MFFYTIFLRLKCTQCNFHVDRSLILDMISPYLHWFIDSFLHTDETSGLIMLYLFSYLFHLPFVTELLSVCSLKEGNRQQEMGVGGVVSLLLFHDNLLHHTWRRETKISDMLLIAQLTTMGSVVQLSLITSLIFQDKICLSNTSVTP